MFSPPEIREGDPMWELELTIECFPKSKAGVEHEEWGLFKHAMRNAMGEEEERPEIRSRVKAGMILWNRWANENVWTELDSYKDVEAWRPSGTVFQHYWRSKFYEQLVDKMTAMVARIWSESDQPRTNSSTQTIPNSSSRPSHEDDKIDSTSSTAVKGKNNAVLPTKAEIEEEDDQRSTKRVTRNASASPSTRKHKGVGQDETMTSSALSAKQMTIEGPGDDQATERSKRAARRAERKANAEHEDA